MEKKARREEYLGAFKLKDVERTLMDSEKKVVGGLIETMVGARFDGLKCVDYAVLPAGDFADFLNNHQGIPERIDLRIVSDAPMGSTMQEVSVERLEDSVKGYLNDMHLPFVQRSGMRWYLAQKTHIEESDELIQVLSDGRHDIYFEVEEDSASRRRSLGIVISNFGDKSLDDHLKLEKEYNQRSKIVLLDSRSLGQRLKFEPNCY